VKRGRGEFRVVSREWHYISKLVPNSASSILRLSKLDMRIQAVNIIKIPPSVFSQLVKDIRVPRKLQRHSLEGIDLSELILRNYCVILEL
jgi:hypothetical protein